MWDAQRERERESTSSGEWQRSATSSSVNGSTGSLQLKSKKKKHSNQCYVVSVQPTHSPEENFVKRRKMEKRRKRLN